MSYFTVSFQFVVAGETAEVTVKDDMPKAIKIADELCSKNLMPRVMISIQNTCWQHLDLQSFLGMRPK